MLLLTKLLKMSSIFCDQWLSFISNFQWLLGILWSEYPIFFLKSIHIYVYYPDNHMIYQVSDILVIFYVSNHWNQKFFEGLSLNLALQEYFYNLQQTVWLRKEIKEMYALKLAYCLEAVSKTIHVAYVYYYFGRGFTSWSSTKHSVSLYLRP